MRGARRLCFSFFGKSSFEPMADQSRNMCRRVLTPPWGELCLIKWKNLKYVNHTFWSCSFCLFLLFFVYGIRFMCRASYCSTGTGTYVGSTYVPTCVIGLRGEGTWCRDCAPRLLGISVEGLPLEGRANAYPDSKRA